MRTINTIILGASERDLENAILSELGMTREEAIRALAEKFGVDLTPEQPQERTVALTPSQQQTLRDAASILGQI